MKKFFKEVFSFDFKGLGADISDRIDIVMFKLDISAIENQLQCTVSDAEFQAKLTLIAEHKKQIEEKNKNIEARRVAYNLVYR